ncbi:MAG: TerB family tellurite resistance protein [Mariprofundaceae bacterium]
MLKSLKRLWNDAVSHPEAGARAHSLELCVAALMVEIMRVDGRIEAAERQQILEQLQQAFELTDQASENLLQQASLVTDKALDMHQFTSRIVKGFSTDERLDILQQLWRVAMADGRVDPYEEQLLRRVADLLGIHHRQFIEAKLAATDDKP